MHSRLRLARLDEDLADADAVVARLLPMELDEGLDLGAAARDALEDVEVAGRPLAVFDERERGSPGSGALFLSRPRRGRARPDRERRDPGGPFRLRWALPPARRRRLPRGPGRSLAPVKAELAALRRTLLAGSLLALALAAGGGWWIARARSDP